ncbi:MAG: hypothetical protein RR387_05645 [Clostridiales bacterium]
MVKVPDWREEEWIREARGIKLDTTMIEVVHLHPRLSKEESARRRQQIEQGLYEIYRQYPVAENNGDLR